ncbi:hypothetical protein B0S90_0103 [Caldicellulosiruptor bescii]|uniref:Uncharacterized protein n=3 Tax=Caldicellulosiruptor TaxID=44000 RepID=B9MPP5_CALBD|nr:MULTISPECIES: hypothetical protein [Caldicellulosiruptor]ACM61678.1 hypothetical protein Athe_2613 [Caldicellulosiruptor bescii DSM 6725]AZT91342.1 hypothetical protein ELD05_12385 [Caldicellulosiruptor changbaiensis]PBC88518.1 hypothetical protein B0S87_1521 [Caldicellulosiruptor bescii]PBC92000.1 hypothetical protein B0S89_2471 [Caldicellulosiruptor bescii]PBD02587.1 hypothetical protein B0S85_0103 [Caldicellulosiruptor bescii]
MSNKKIWLYIIGVILIILSAVIAKVFFNVKSIKAAIIIFILLFVWHGWFQAELLKMGRKTKK